VFGTRDDCSLDTLSARSGDTFHIEDGEGMGTLRVLAGVHLALLLGTRFRGLGRQSQFGRAPHARSILLASRPDCPDLV
jgi:hypothetical protein